MDESVRELELENKIHEIRGYIASEWPGIEERKHMYQKLYLLENELKQLKKKS